MSAWSSETQRSSSSAIESNRSHWLKSFALGVWSVMTGILRGECVEDRRKHVTWAQSLDAKLRGWSGISDVVVWSFTKMFKAPREKLSCDVPRAQAEAAHRVGPGLEHILGWSMARR